MSHDTQIGYEIRLPQFEGPFDLLLFFIERDELDINDIPIAKITDDFLDYIQQMQALNIELASEFIYMAATLMRIKVKSLLPRPEEDEEGNEINLERELMEKLVLYKQFKNLCEELRRLEDQRWMQHRRGSVALDLSLSAPYATTAADDLDSVDLYKLMLIYERLMARYEDRRTEARHTVVRYPYTIEQQKEMIASLVAINARVGFSTLTQHSENRVHFVYNFLAVLEMLQQQLLEIQVGMGFNNFWITSSKASPDTVP